MLKKNVVIINKLGLHTRAAARFVETAAAYQADIRVKAGDKTVDGKSIMGLMMLAAAKGTNVELAVHGKDEERAVTALVRLIENRFGEET